MSSTWEVCSLDNWSHPASTPCVPLGQTTARAILWAVPQTNHWCLHWTAEAAGSNVFPSSKLSLESERPHLQEIRALQRAYSQPRSLGRNPGKKLYHGSSRMAALLLATAAVPAQPFQPWLPHPSRPPIPEQMAGQIMLRSSGLSAGHWEAINHLWDAPLQPSSTGHSSFHSQTRLKASIHLIARWRYDKLFFAPICGLPLSCIALTGPAASSRHSMCLHVTAIQLWRCEQGLVQPGQDAEHCEELSHSTDPGNGECNGPSWKGWKILRQPEPSGVETEHVGRSRLLPKWSRYSTDTANFSSKPVWLERPVVVFPVIVVSCWAVVSVRGQECALQTDGSLRRW